MTSYSLSHSALLIVLVSIGVNVTIADLLITALSQKIRDEQVTVAQPFIPMLLMERLIGYYKTDIIQNFHGEPALALLRQNLRVADNNMFISCLVTVFILDGFMEGAPRPTNQQIELFLDVLKNHHDKNKPYNNSIMAFWRAQLNQSTDYWNFNSVNYLDSLNTLSSTSSPLAQVLLNVVDPSGQLKNTLEHIKEDKANLVRAGYIPPDQDDIFLNIIVGAMLRQRRDLFPRSWQVWQNQNSNLTSAFYSLKKYAYRPFSSDPNSNSIDPRSYFYLRGFLDKAKAEGRDVALGTTWVQNIEELRKEFKLGVGMPYLVNNVDMAVGIDVVYGICIGVTSEVLGPELLDDPDTVQILLNTTSVVAYQLANNFSNRPELALFYYPSSFNFFMFVAKTFELLHSARYNGDLLLKPLEKVYQILQEPVKGPLTITILSQVQKKGSDQFYFDEFLGNGDTLLGVPLKKGEDRIFATAAAANALMSAWTNYNSTTKKYTWIPETRNQIKNVVRGCLKWLRQNTLNPLLQPYNALFSGTTKGFSTVPFWYPGNRLEYLNGTTISDFSRIPTSTFLYAVQGYVPPDQYAAQVNQTHFGVPTPTTFNGYNGPDNVFPIWVSPAYTYSVALLALAKHKNIE